MKLALANLAYPRDPEDSLRKAADAVARAGTEGARLLCFPEGYVPGYRGLGHAPPPPDESFLERAWGTLAESAARAGVAVVLGTERVVEGALRLTALVLDERGQRLGFQDKVQLDPSEDETYACGEGRALFEAGSLRFGVVLCHEGWRYPETVRWAARRGAQLVLHPHYHTPEPGAFRPRTFADPRSSFHEKAALCRAAENTCFFATVNCAVEGAQTTSAVVRPDGTVQAWQPYGVEGLLLAELDLSLATGLLASRCRSTG